MKITHPIRFVTAAALFDGHDAAIHIMRRILQAEGAEVIHLGHNVSARAVVKAAVEEDVHGIAISSYQGGHIEYFGYLLELLKEYGAPHIKIFGGGGGVITPHEIKILEKMGVTKIFSPDDAIKMGLVGMIQFMISACDYDLPDTQSSGIYQIANTISRIELEELKLASRRIAPVIGITGTGGAGKSSLIDELILRYHRNFPHKTIAVLSIDPSKIKSGGALLGDRIRMNMADKSQVFIRSMATRNANQSISKTAREVLDYLSSLSFDLVLLETAGIGQSDTSVKDLCDGSIYVMTPEYGAPSQLEKIGMLDFADMVVINKFDKAGALDAIRDVRKTWARNHQLFNQALETMPVFGTSAHIVGDLGTNKLFNHFIALVKKVSPEKACWDFQPEQEGEPACFPLIPKKRSRYLSQVADTVREHHAFIESQAKLLDKIEVLKDLGLDQEFKKLEPQIDPDLKLSIDQFFSCQSSYQQAEQSYMVRDKTIKIDNFSTSLSHLAIPKVSVPNFKKLSQAAHFVGLENLPGYFPYTAGVFPFKRESEDPTRMFAGEGSPERTNKRFHYLSQNHEATRLSTAFDSVTLYGANPDLRPDIYGKIGNAGVSVCSLDDAKRLYSGFDLTALTTSVSMTINGPAPSMLAFFLNAAIDFEVEKELKKNGHWPATHKKINNYFVENNLTQPKYRAESLPDGHNSIGLAFLGIPSSLIVESQFYHNIKKHVFSQVRGTVQADILKEDQAQNTCIFSTDFSLRIMGDIQEYFIKHNINNFYSVSISGYHIAEAGANPITQLAFTLANGFSLLEYYLARGMKVDDFAKSFSFFFSNGLDAEYAVIGRVARRIWALALKKIYGASARSQMLKYHIQTSGRSLHAQEMAFNDIRTTLQALYAIADNCNSLHTNAYDEAVTTPTEESVRRAVAIQMIINHELGLSKNQNPWQGSYFIEDLTNKVEEAVLQVFASLDERGGVFGAMESMYQRSMIQEESLYYEQKKLSGELKIIGVNSFLNQHQESVKTPELMRSTTAEKNMQVEQVAELKRRFVKERAQSLDSLASAALRRENTFEQLMHAAQFSTIGEISDTFFKVGGAYRRAM